MPISTPKRNNEFLHSTMIIVKATPIWCKGNAVKATRAHGVGIFFVRGVCKECSDCAASVPPRNDGP
jgi:hypothetical protein